MNIKVRPNIKMKKKKTLDDEMIEQDIDNLHNKLWYVINSDKEKKKQNEDYYLCEGDIIKLGAELFNVRKINIQNNNNIEDKNEENIYDIHSLNKNTPLIFDIYFVPKLLEENNFCSHIINELKDPKIIKRLQKKFENEKEKSDKEKMKKNVKYYNFKLERCNECKRIKPLRFKFSENSEIIDLINIDIPKNKNYFILESIKIDILEIYIIELTGEDEEIITIGRKDDNNVVIDEKSQNKAVNRYHAVIKYFKNKGKLLLKNRSEYGTMVLIKNKKINISDKKEIYLQVRRTFITAKVIDKNEYINLKKEEEKIKKEIEKEKEKEREKNINRVDENESNKQEKGKEFYGDF